VAWNIAYSVKKCKPSLSCGQDLLLCGIYGRMEASHGNIDQARKIFDMALLSTEGATQVPCGHKINVFIKACIFSSDQFYLLRTLSVPKYNMF
jgi:hypothetical protein